jgi:hypothetical protein
MPTIPLDGRAQYSMADVVVANVGSGREPFAGVKQIGADRYVLANSWPAPVKGDPWAGGFSPEAPVSRPRTPASALWPDLPSAAAGVRT